MRYKKIEIRTYGNYLCSCGCGKVMGNPTVYFTEDDICPAVCDVNDDEGWEWRMFRPDCWKKLNLDKKSLEDIYNEYPIAKEVGLCISIKA